MAENELLPEEYFYYSNSTRLRVGGWAWHEYYPFAEQSIPSAYLWRIKKTPSGKYQAVAYGYPFVIPITPKNSCTFEWVQASERFQLDTYPGLLKRFHAKGLMIYCYDAPNADLVFRVKKPGGRRREFTLPADAIKDIQTSIPLLSAWLEQLLWCMKYPSKADALQWAARETASSPFGTWPNLFPPESLDEAAYLVLPLFQAWKRQSLWDTDQQQQEQELRLALQVLERATKLNLLSDEPPALPPPPQPTPSTKKRRLPKEYPSHSKYSRLSVGCWAWNHYHVPNTPRDASPYLWRIEESAPGQYQVVAYGYPLVVPITPENSCEFNADIIQPSERLRLDQHPEALQRFHQKGIMAYFHDGPDGNLELWMRKYRGSEKNIALPAYHVEELQRDTLLLDKWLDHMLWCIEHPRKASALFWGVAEGFAPFGKWPHLVSIKELDATARKLYPRFQEKIKRLKLAAAEPDFIQKILQQQYEREQELHDINRIQGGEHDEQLRPGLRNLLDGTGIEPAPE